jgi:hypothetical protein
MARDNTFQYDSILQTEPSHKWISIFRIRVRERSYESKVVKLISIHPVIGHQVSRLTNANKGGDE